MSSHYENGLGGGGTGCRRWKGKRKTTGWVIVRVGDLLDPVVVFRCSVLAHTGY